MGREKTGYDVTKFRQRSVKLGDPWFVASSDTARTIAITVPVGAVWQFVCGRSTVVSTATVGTRTIQINIVDSLGNSFFFRNGTATLAASAILHTNLFPTAADGVLSSNTAYIPTPEVILMAGDVFTIRLATGIDAADAHTFVALFKELI